MFVCLSTTGTLGGFYDNDHYLLHVQHVTWALRSGSGYSSRFVCVCYWSF